MMDEKKIARINQLAAKSKTAEGLTPEEKQEQLALKVVKKRNKKRRQRLNRKNKAQEKKKEEAKKESK